MNIDFNADPGFSAYVLLLMFSGGAMIILASNVVKGSPIWLRALNALVGVGFLGYGFYLAFLFTGGGYFLFFKAFILPVVLIVRTIRSARASQSQELPVRAGGPVSDAQKVPPSPAESAHSSGDWGPPSYGERRTQP